MPGFRHFMKIISCLRKYSSFRVDQQETDISRVTSQYGGKAILSGDTQKKTRGRDNRLSPEPHGCDDKQYD